jgi:hypothetical protein
MADLSLSDLHNPRKIIGLGLKNGILWRQRKTRVFRNTPALGSFGK